MGNLDSIVQLQITKQTTAPTRLGFGIPMAVAYHTVKPDRVLTYTSLAGMIADGFTVNDPAYQMVAAAFSQNPRPTKVLVGRRALPPTQVLDLYPQDITEGDIYKFEVVSPGGVITSIEYVVPGAATTTSVVNALQALIDPVTDVVATNVGNTHVHMVTSPGLLCDLRKLPGTSMLKIDDNTADPGIATDLAAIYAADPLTWYAIEIDSQSPAEVEATAAWVQGFRKLFLANTTQSDVLDGGVSDDLASTLKAAGYTRTALLYSKNRLRSYSAAAWAGVQLPKTPGGSTWCFKNLVGIAVDAFTDSEVAALEAKNCNYYMGVGGVSITQSGYTSAGTSDFLDIVHGVDWLYARIQEAVFAVLANVEKIPFTDSGVASVVSTVKGVLTKGVKATLLAVDPAPIVLAPAVKDVDTSDKINRFLPDVTFTATLAGAIHKVAISGVLSV